MTGRALRLLRTLVGALLVLVIVPVLLSALLTGAGVLRVRGELTGSMAPLLEPGDLVVYRPVRADRIEAGDVISFERAGSDLPVTHRVTQARRDGGDVVLATRGDANVAPDAEPAIFRATQRVWRVAGHLPLAGALLAAVTGWHGLPFLVGLVLLYLVLPTATRLLTEPPVAAEPEP